MILIYKDEQYGDIYTVTVPDKIVEDSISYINSKDFSVLDNIKESVCTFGGKQTENILNQKEINLISNGLFNVIESGFGEACPKFEIVHIHAIDYMQGGYQIPHTHMDTENFSFVLYLDDTESETLFWVNGDIKGFKSEKGKLLVFDSRLLHWATPTNTRKRVIVGACKIC